MSEKLDDKPKRKAPVSWRPPPGKDEEFAALVKDSGLPSQNSFITHAVFERPIPRKVTHIDRQLLRQVLAETGNLATAEQKNMAELGHIGGNMNQIAAAGNMGRRLDNLHEQTLKELRELIALYKQVQIDKIEIRQAILQALGKHA